MTFLRVGIFPTVSDMSVLTDTHSVPGRHNAVHDFFAQHRQSWLDRYESSSFDAQNYRRRADAALGMLATVAPRGRRLLEVGCGAGVQAAAAHRLGWNVFATDLTVELLLQAQDQFHSPHWVAAAAEELPFPEGSFDVIVMLGVIGYVVEPARVLQYLRTLLVPEGHLIISWAYDHTLLASVSRAISAVPDWLYGKTKQFLRGHSAEQTESTPNFYTSYNRFWNQREFMTLIDEAGFTIHQTRSINFGQLRFMDKALWPERVDCLLSSALERTTVLPSFGWLGEYSRTHVALAQRQE